MSRYHGRSRGRSYYEFAPYVPVEERRRRSERAAATLRRKNPDVQPVTLDGYEIATTWWGKSWNENLERYADYENRIGRGRSYVRNGAVLDLRIAAGKVSALVQGSRPSPYKVTVTIKPLAPKVWAGIRAAVEGRLDSLADLLGGKFPPEVKDVFFAQRTGLFPAPGEISLDCSCPDWAEMCKHVAAVLYGIGNRLDTCPELLFTLRQVTVADLISHTLDATAKGLLKRADEAGAGEDVLAGTDVSGLFGIALETTPASAAESSPSQPGKGRERAGVPARLPVEKTRPQARTDSARTAARRPASPRRRPPPRQAPPPEKAAPAPAPPSPPRGRMLADTIQAARRLRGQWGFADLANLLPGWTRQQTINALQRAIAAGFVIRVAQGLYRTAGAEA